MTVSSHLHTFVSMYLASYGSCFQWTKGWIVITAGVAKMKVNISFGLVLNSQVIVLCVSYSVYRGRLSKGQNQLQILL